jgi:spoIIIJ-associated protein
MPLEDKVAAAKRIDQFLRDLLSAGGFLLKYRIMVDPPLEEDRDWERPQILVAFSGPDGPLLLERGAELLRSFEHVTQKMLRLESEEHDKVVFDCMNHRAMRLQELRLAARVAAEKVLKTGVPYEFAPMTARERRIVHLALRDHLELKTESQGEGPRRCVVVLPKNTTPRKKS